MLRLRERFQRWSQTIDPDVRKSIGDPGVWVGITILVALVLLGVVYVPGAGDFFELDVVPPVVAYVPAFLLGVAVGVLEKRNRLSAKTFALLALLDSALGQFFTWTLVASSELPGATVMVAFPTILAGYHGHALRSAPEQPFIALASVSAVAGAVLLNHDPDHIPLYVVGGPLAVGGCLVLGRISLLQYGLSRERAALREAVDAQVLNAQARRLEEVVGALLEMQGSSHDAGNALSGLTMTVERLSVLAHRRPLDDAACDSIQRLSAGLLDTLGRLERILQQARQAVRAESVPNEVVDLEHAVDNALADVRPRFAATALSCAVESGDRPLHVEVCGGQTNLERLLTNLFTNACEGDGVSRASTVLIVARRRGHERVVLEVVDDGPGLSDASLEDPFRAFRSSKSGGTGLGLYTSRQLVRASGGSLVLENRSDRERGAVVRLELRSGVYST